MCIQGVFANDSTLWRLHERLMDAAAGGNGPDLTALVAEAESAPAAAPWRAGFIDLLKAVRAHNDGRSAEAYAVIEGLLADSVRLDPLLVFDARRERSRVLKALGLIDRALKDAEQARRIAEARALPREQVECLLMVADARMRLAAHAAALEALIAAERIAGTHGLARQRCRILLGRGNLFFHQERYTDALRLYEEVEVCATNVGDRNVLSLVLYNLGGVAAYLHGPQAAIGHYRRVLATAIEAGDARLEAEARANIASMHNRAGEHAKAIGELRLALARPDALRDPVFHAQLLNYLATAHHGHGATDSALILTDRVIALAAGAGELGLLAEAQNKRCTYLNVLGRPSEAVTCLRTVIALRDSLNEMQRGRTVSALEIEYETEKKEQALRLQELELQQARIEKRRRETQRNVLIATVAALIAIGVLAVRSLMQKRRLADQARRLSEQRVEQVLSERELRSIDAMLQGQEKERKRIAQDLHDRVGSLLSAVKLQFGALEAAMGGPAHGEAWRAGKVAHLLDEAVAEVRRVSHSMASGSLAQFGLTKALHDLRDAVQVSGLSLSVETFGLEQRLPLATEIGAYRIVQELVSNALKHARASRIEIYLTRKSNSLNVIVEDNGSGFDPNTVRQGLGLQGMHERAMALGGEVHLDSRPGRGTVVTVDLPVKELYTAEGEPSDRGDRDPG